MSTPPNRPVPLEQLELAEAFFRELGLPFAWHLDPDGNVHAFALVDDVPAAAGGRRGAPARRKPAQRGRRKR